MRSRNYCFTLNNYTQEDESKIQNWDLPKYITYGHEIGKQQTSHLQGYVEFKNPIRLTTLKKFNEKIHWEIRRGTSQQAIDYCHKEDKEPFIKGQPSKQGKRTDIENVTKNILEGKSITNIALEYPKEFIKYHKGIEKLHGHVLKERTKEFRQVKTRVYWGDTGTGKTRQTFRKCQDNYYKLDCANHLWFDGYQGEENLIIDDFYGWIRFGQLLNLLDGHPLRLEIKGSFTYANWNSVFITSNTHPSEWYKALDQKQLAALSRRLNKIKEFKL